MSGKPVVVFVCEHGSAKSVVAAALFNQRAGARGLHVRAVARGTNPDEAIAPAAAAGLHADGLTSSEPAPTKLSEGDLVAAIRIVAFCPLPGEYHDHGGAAVQQWEDVPPVSEDYARARDALVERIERLLADLDTRG